MPYVSDRQRRFFHTATARRKGITAAMVREYDAASKGNTYAGALRRRKGHGKLDRGGN